jgi:hypothetical protein
MGRSRPDHPPILTPPGRSTGPPGLTGLGVCRVTRTTVRAFRTYPTRGTVPPMPSGTIWLVVGILAIIALGIWIASNVTIN